MTDVEADPERTTVERVDARLGRVLRDRYRIDHKLAAGGFGSVYRASDLESRKHVAIKVLHPELVRDPAVVARFRREASALGSLRDPHTVHALDAGEEPDGTLYIVMELLAGESLYEHFKSRGPLAWQRMCAIARCVCSSLAEAHALGIVHRDLKPANIHLEANDHAKVLDFGIAKILDTSMLIGGDLTQVGQMIGTYDYMPPEQMIGTCTPESDLFTLGVVIYEMIAGKRPFGEARGPAAQLANVIGTTPELLANVPPELARIVARCIAREPADRYHDARVLAADLGAVLLAHHFAVGTSDESLDDVLDRLGDHRERPVRAITRDGFDNPAFDSTALAPARVRSLDRTTPGAGVARAPLDHSVAPGEEPTTASPWVDPTLPTPPPAATRASSPRITPTRSPSLDRTTPGAAVARATPLDRTALAAPITPPGLITPAPITPTGMFDRTARTTPMPPTSTTAPITPTAMLGRAATAPVVTRTPLPGLPPERASAHDMTTQLAVPITPVPPTPVPHRTRPPTPNRASVPTLAVTPNRASSPSPTPPRPQPLAELDLSARVPRNFMPNATLLGLPPPPMVAHGSSDQRDAAQRVRFATGTTPTADVLASDSSSAARPPTGDGLARRPSSTGFDLQQQARRDAMARLAVWLVILAAITIAALIALR